MDERPSLRRAVPDDAGPIAALVDAAYRDYTGLIGRTPLPMLADYSQVVREHETWVLATGDGRIVGVIELVAHPDHLWVENIAIEPHDQGGGLGRRLLLHAESEARRRDLPEVRLLTNERYARNIAIYLHYGYVETHRDPYQGTDLVHFRKVLPAT